MAGYFSTLSSDASISQEILEEEEDGLGDDNDGSMLTNSFKDISSMVEAQSASTSMDQLVELKPSSVPHMASDTSTVFITPSQSFTSCPSWYSSRALNEQTPSWYSSRGYSFTGHRSVDLTAEKIHDATADTFFVRSVLGKGSFGTVYKVSEKATGKSFAMKVLQKEAILRQGILRYAITERNVQAMMNHPFIVGLVCAFQTPHELVLVMPFCGGGTLEKLVQAKNGLPEETAKHYFAEILLAIECVHRHSVIYRDLKCENIVLDDLGHAMLTDFGLSKENIVGRGTTGTFVGSEAFISPEILKSQRHGKPVDVYGLGVVLFEMLTTFPPFYSEDKEQMFVNVKSAPLELPSFVSEDCASMLRTTLDRKPQNRPRTSFQRFAASAVSIRRHPFMASVDFDAVFRREGPVMKLEPRRSPSVPVSTDISPPFKAGRRGQKVEGWEYPVPGSSGGALGKDRWERWRGCFQKLIGVEPE